MGNAFSPFIANLFMGFFEKNLKRRKIFPKTWVRYVDDVFAIVPKDKIDDLLAFWNCPHESTKIYPRN
jgi:hypothetical protein